MIAIASAKPQYNPHEQVKPIEENHYDDLPLPNFLRPQNGNLERPSYDPFLFPRPNANFPPSYPSYSTGSHRIRI